MLEAVIIGSARSMPGLFSSRRRIRRLRRFNWRWTLAFTRKPPGVDESRGVDHLDCSPKPGGFRTFRPQQVWGYAWLRLSPFRTGMARTHTIPDPGRGRTKRMLARAIF